MVWNRMLLEVKATPARKCWRQRCKKRVGAWCGSLFSDTEGEKGRESMVGLDLKLKGDRKSEDKGAITRLQYSPFPVQGLSFVLACAALQMEPKRFLIQLFISRSAKLQECSRPGSALVPSLIKVVYFLKHATWDLLMSLQVMQPCFKLLSNIPNSATVICSAYYCYRSCRVMVFSAKYFCNGVD